MSKPTDRAFPRLSKSQLLISLAMLTIPFLALTAEGWMTPASPFSATNDCLIGTSFPISQSPEPEETPAIAYNSQNDECLAVWRNEESNICWKVVPAAGTEPDNGGFCTHSSVDQQSPALASNSSDNSSNNCQYLVVWQEKNFDPACGWDISGQLISCTPKPKGDAFRFSAHPDIARAKDQRYPAVAYNIEAKEYLVVWQDKSCRSYPHCTADDIYGWIVDSEGRLKGNVIPISIATDCESDESVQQNPAVAYNSHDDHNEYLVVWEDDRNGNWDIYGQLLSTAGTLLGNNFPIVEIQGVQRYPDLVYNSQDDLYLVVWQDNRCGNWDIYGRRVLPAGRLYGDLCISESDGSEQFPAVAYNGEDKECLVVWQDYRNGDEGIYGQRVGSGDCDDALLGDECLISTVANGQKSPDVAYNSKSQSKEYIVVWQDNDDIYGQRVRSAPTPTPTSTPTPTPTNTITSTPPYYLYLPIIMKNYPRNHVQDPGFEMGPDTPHWKQSTKEESLHELIDCTGEYAPHSGRCLALLAGWNKQNDELWQDIQNVTVPSGCTSGMLTLYYYFYYSTDPPPTEDHFNVYIRDSDGNTIIVVDEMDYTDRTDTYELLSHDFNEDDLEAIEEAEGNIQLYFQVITDEDDAALVHIDDVVLTLCQ